MNCTLSDDEFEDIRIEIGESPCLEYGMCEECPYYDGDA